MMKKIFVILTSFIILLGSLSIQVENINAAGISASTSSRTVAVGGTFTATVRASGVFVDGLTVSAEGGTIISGLSRKTLDQGESLSVTVRLDSASGATVYFSGNAADYASETEYAVSASASVSAKKQQSSSTSSSSSSGSSSSGSSSSSSSSSSSGSSQSSSSSKPAQEPADDSRSKNYDLSSLTVDKGTLSPKFDPDTTTYKVSLPNDATEITVSAKAEDSKATVSGTGKKELKAGDNKIEVTCTSEYGTKQVYTINVYVDEEPLVYFDLDGAKLGVVRNTTDVKAPEGFKESKVKTDDGEIVAWTNEKMNQTIVYLIDENDEKGFYLLEDGKVTSSFKPISVAGRTLYQIDIPKVKQSLTEMTFTTVKIKDLELPGWTFNNKDLNNFLVIYVMNEKGERCYYQYDSTEETLQLFNGLTIDNEAYQSVKQMEMVGFAVAGVAVVALIGLGVWMLIKQKKAKMIE